MLNQEVGRRLRICPHCAINFQVELSKARMRTNLVEPPAELYDQDLRMDSVLEGQADSGASELQERSSVHSKPPNKTGSNSVQGPSRLLGASFCESFICPFRAVTAQRPAVTCRMKQLNCAPIYQEQVLRRASGTLLNSPSAKWTICPLDLLRSTSNRRPLSTAGLGRGEQLPVGPRCDARSLLADVLDI